LIKTDEFIQFICLASESASNDRSVNPTNSSNDTISFPPPPPHLLDRM